MTDFEKMQDFEKYFDSLNLPKDQTEWFMNSLKTLADAMKVQQEVIQNHERAIGVLLREVKALKTAADQKPKIWTP